MKVNIADRANLSLLKLPARLKEKLEAAEVVASDEVPADVVTMQCMVVLAEAGTEHRHTASLVYPAEADAASGRISVLDTLGTELLGASLGDVIDWDGPNGRCRLRVVEILYQPEKSMRSHLFVRG